MPETKNASGGTVPQGIAAQAEQSCQNVGAIPEAAVRGFDRVVKTVCFLADMGDFTAFNEVYARHFASKPAAWARRTCPKASCVRSEPSPSNRHRADINKHQIHFI